MLLTLVNGLILNVLTRADMVEATEAMGKHHIEKVRLLIL